MNGYTIEVYCHNCCTTVIRVGPYVIPQELMEDIETMMDRHAKKVHSQEATK